MQKREEREKKHVVVGFKKLLTRDGSGEGDSDDVTYKYDAFVSYANQDDDFVYSLVEVSSDKWKVDFKAFLVIDAIQTTLSESPQ